MLPLHMNRRSSLGLRMCFPDPEEEGLGYHEGVLRLNNQGDLYSSIGKANPRQPHSQAHAAVINPATRSYQFSNLSKVKDWEEYGWTKGQMTQQDIDLVLDVIPGKAARSITSIPAQLSDQGSATMQPVRDTIPLELDRTPVIHLTDKVCLLPVRLSCRKRTASSCRASSHS